MDIPRKKIIEEQKENNNEISGLDSQVYDFLDSNLEKENTDSFSLGFSKNIIRKIEAKQQRRFNVKIYGLISILVVMSIPLFINLLDSEFILMIFSTFIKYKLTSAFIIIAVILIQFGGKSLSYKKDIS
ncbi:hypothetical protein M2347_002097 [Chryseobacterium sp. H1D6B]|uniref:hypothetical protein n=1 Tax=Chryseobacterium sp. H1D6B TaxID=2940588 RepID=UPI0015CBFD1A|nr:hypothetical protein [Chryseobacterium sp. H1D6B]MDH6252370.1 hypothetical protein [Chryseobacterium sp. H1D6B]